MELQCFGSPLLTRQPLTPGRSVSTVHQCGVYLKCATGFKHAGASVRRERQLRLAFVGVPGACAPCGTRGTQGGVHASHDARRLRRSTSGLLIRRCSVHRAVGLLEKWRGTASELLSSESSWLHLAPRPLKIGLLGTFVAIRVVKMDMKRRSRRLQSNCCCKDRRVNYRASRCYRWMNVTEMWSCIETRCFCNEHIPCLLLPYLGCDMAKFGRPADSDNQTAIANSLPSRPGMLRRRRRHTVLHVIPLQNLHRHPHRCRGGEATQEGCR